MARDSDRTGDDSSKRESADRPFVQRADLIPTADSIEGDFRRLVLLLNRTMEIVEGSDDELVARLSKTKSAAERGLKLSKTLSELTRTKRD